MELKIELDHMLAIIDFALAAQSSFNTSLTTVSPVFKKRSDSLQEHFDTSLITTWST